MGMYEVYNAHMPPPWLIGCEHALTVLYNECMYSTCVCVCACSTHSVDHLFLVCAFVFASGIINYNHYSFDECAICITYTRKSWSRNASACLYMWVYNLLADFPCVYVYAMDQKLLVQTRVLLVCAQPWSLSTVFCNIIQLHSTLQSYICKALFRAKHIIIIIYIIIILYMQL